MMQFNPLFLNDIKGNQAPNNNSGKLQKNQYLFSDIIKVVMKDSAPEENMNKLSLEDQTEDAEIIGGNFVQVSEQLQNITITDADKEKMKIKLADILPEDMAKLLTTDDNKINGAQIVSYIGKEQLQGELKNFLTGLVGEKVFKEHVNDESGVLLKLEDAKSSVNIEITKEVGNNSKENKTMVHALIVPQKSKLQLLSEQNNLLTEIKNNKLLNNVIDTSKLEKLEKGFNSNVLGKIEKISNENNSKAVKPTLSVFAFKIKNEDESSMMLSEKLKTLVKKNENELENIIRTTKFLKTETTVKDNSKNLVTKNEIISKTNNVKSEVEKGNLFETNKIKSENNLIKPQKDFNISKITIIKKQDASNIKQPTNNKNQNGNVKNIVMQLNKKSVDASETVTKESQPKEINVEKDLVKNDLLIKQKSNSNELAKPNNQLKTNPTDNELLVKADNISKETTNEVKQVLSHKATNITINKNDNHVRETEVQPKEKNNDNDIKTSGESVTKNNTSDLEKKSSAAKTIEQQPTKDILQNIDKSQQTVKEIIEPEKNITTEKSTDENNTQTKSSSGAKLENRNIDLKSPNQNDTKIIEQENKNNIRNIQSNSSAVNEVIVEKVVKNLMPNKKISVKVKKVVKSVNKKNEKESNISSEIRLEQKEEKMENNSDLNYSKDSQNLKHPDLDVHSKKKSDTAFHHLIHKEIGAKINETGITPQEIRQQNSEKIVKSIEVIKEISRFISTRKKGSFSFTIHPEHLGHLKITLETNNHLLNAHIQVENEQAKLLVEKNLNELHTQLQESGVELNSLNISLGYSSEQKDSFQQKNKQKLEYSEPIKEEINNSRNKTKSLGYNTYEYLA